MSSEISTSTISLDTKARRSLITPDDSNPTIPFAIDGGNNIQQSKPRAGITRHYTSLQEHADQMRIDGEYQGERRLTPRHDYRRESTSWGPGPISDDRHRGTGNPLPPEQPRTETPPLLEELIRRLAKENTIGKRVPTFTSDDTIGSETSTGTGSTLDTNSNSNTRKSSIADFLARHVPDMRMFASENTSERKPEAKNSKSQNESTGESLPTSIKKERKLSFALPPMLKSKDTRERMTKPTLAVGEPPSESPSKPLTPQSSAQRGLKDRRKIKMDLTLPLEMPNLPTRSRLPIAHLNIITPSRPRSPRTPWIRDEQPRRHQDTGSKTVTTIEESSVERDYIHGNMGGSNLLPGDDHLFSSQSPVFERPPTKVRDRCYVSRPVFGRSRSGRSGTSESTLARTPDSNWTLSDSQVLQEHQTRTKEELRQLGQSNKAVRGRRWGWGGRWISTGSDSPAQSPDSDPIRRFSVNIFKRSGHFSDPPDKKQKQQSPYNRPWWRKNSIPASRSPPSNLAHMPLPPPFVPPGLHRVPTPPMFDVNGEVKGKLADFFFDIHGAPGRKRPSKSPGSIWDSDALLMSLQTNLDDDDDDDDEEEGPKGRASKTSLPMNFKPDYDTPGLMPGLDEYPIGKEGNPGYRVSSPGLPDSWFRMQRGDTSNEQALTTSALKKSDERRKFEWLVPEHLPNSPLCPLHAKYRGPSIGVCYWHGAPSAEKKKKKSGERERAGKQDMQEEVARPVVMRQESRGLYDSPYADSKKRRLESLSSP
ncbi:hypothetical protein P153DRAFT_360681 [Dothidotthia symphoricarpi CBS 119687]|uniref:Uncharacterized protein n=1 Tax=Dothidotthia symphoricarpi CBS 119687 TaxID=1392245 RepID=A0A6A6A3A4_9PLEO|nr:uncharacterized protein P153DRAFT_360681 [Dothidotthia symphoricarpi CBS 119687]KAF2125061.1 hypothetical protein P153DRAFT_360681 [Dothidotthia symphoricarpi CBS 119687]